VLQDADVIAALAALGGAARAADLRAVTSRRALRRAIAAGKVRRPRPGSVCLPVLDETTAAIRDLAGARSHVSAALHHGWEVVAAPARPTVTIRRSTHLPRSGAGVARVFWGSLTDEELDAGVTSPIRTVVDCARVLPFEQALAVADSALRSGDVEPQELREAAASSPRTGRSRAVRVSAAADGRAANPFESVLRALAGDVAGLHVIPQVTIGGRELIGTADLVDTRLGIVVEAESWTYHGGRAAFDRDVRRYTAMVSSGWIVLRFLWDDVRRRPAEVTASLAAAVTLAQARPRGRQP
jgi:very-short-patch-repair endonuclease